MLRNRSLLALIAVMIASSLTGCNRTGASEPGHQPSAAPQTSPAPEPLDALPLTFSAPAETVWDSSVRRFDFDQVRYPNYPDDSDERMITTKPGEVGPSHINYGDATGDGIEEAMVVVPIDTGYGTAIISRVYVFTSEKHRPRLIWDFDTGDRADGGVCAVYADRGEMVVELYGKNRVVGGELYGGEEGLCCPSSITRTRYRWVGGKFESIGSILLPNS